MNNVWIGDLRVWAREARFDRFAQYDVENRVPIRGGKRVENGREMRPVVITHGEGVKNVRVSKEKEEVKNPEEEKKMVTIGKVEVNVGKKTKKKNKLKNKRDEGVEGAVIKAEEAAEEGKKVWEPKLKMVEKENIAQIGEDVPKEVLLYNSRLENRGWADGGLVAKVVPGDSSLALQQMVDDAGFDNIVVTPMGSDMVFLHCSGGGDMLQVFYEAFDFFNMLFTDIHKWTSNDAIYERGAWVQVYGTPVHAWNELFFKICVSGCGRFIRLDECTVDKARLDYARVLISTTFLEVINATSEVVIDGCKYLLKLVEEWGCNIGEDAFMSEDESDSRAEVLSIGNEVPVMEEFKGDVDDFVNDFNEEWQNRRRG